MGRRQTGIGCGTVIVLVLAGLFVMGAVQALNDRDLSPRDRTIGWVIAGTLVLGLLAVVASKAKPRKARVCGVCGCPIVRRFYRGTIKGQPLIFCPNCRRRLAEKISKQAVDRLDI